MLVTGVVAAAIVLIPTWEKKKYLMNNGFKYYSAYDLVMDTQKWLGARDGMSKRSLFPMTSKKDATATCCE